MGQPLSTSYGCCDLRTGCIIIGYLELVGFLFGTIAFAVTAAHVWPGTSAIILLVAAILLLASGITLLIGAYKEWSEYVLAHLVIALIIIILCLVSLFLPVLIIPWWYIVLGLVALGFSIYHWLIALSYYMEIS